jgi:hypothetical protein
LINPDRAGDWRFTWNGSGEGCHSISSLSGSTDTQRYLWLTNQM